MNRKIKTKLSIIVVFCIMFLYLITTSTVEATDIEIEKKQMSNSEISIDNKNVEKLIDLDTTEEKIMEYDATTGETKEVDMKQLKQEIEKLYATRGLSTNRTESYDPYNFINKFNNNVARSRFGRVTNISSISDFPYRVTCKLTCNDDNDLGSGFLVGDKMLLTAAHCVMNQNNNDQYYGNWIAYPGYNNGTYKGMASGWSKVYYSSKWKSTHSVEYDWCLCILNNPMGAQLGHYGCQAYGTNNEMTNLSIRMLGYPGGEEYGNDKYQYYSDGNISNVFDRYFYSSALSVPGFSGGPINRTSDNYAIGIVRGHDIVQPEISAGVRITQNIIDLILSNN